MDQFEALVRLNQLRQRKSKDLSLKWIVLSSLTCFLLLFGSFSYNWLYTSMNPILNSFGRDMYPYGGMGMGMHSSMSDLSYGMNGLGGMGMGMGFGGLGGFGGYPMNAYRRHGVISTIGPFSACFESHSRFDFFGFQCRMPTDSFFKLRHRVPTTLVLSEFLLVLGSLVFVFSTVGSCCGCFGRHRLIGLLQSGAGIIYLLGIILFFGNLGDRVSKMFCGIMTEPFYMGYCHVGIGLYVSVIANISMFICSLVYLKSLNDTPRRKSMPDVNKV